MSSDLEPKISALTHFLSERYNLPNYLGLESEVDSTLLKLYFEQRILRGHIYFGAWFLSRPGTSVVVRFPLIGSIIRAIDRSERGHRADLEVLEKQTGEYLEKHYATPAEKIKARIIEFAVNEIVAITANRQITHRRLPFNPSPDELATWSEKWRPQILSVPGTDNKSIPIPLLPEA